MAGIHWHHLQLIDKLESDGKKEVCCWLCKKPVLGSHSYKCIEVECNFFLHESCPEPIDKIDIKAQQHDLSETHHLISMKELDNNGENTVVCSMCEEPVSCLLGNNGPTIYKCSIPNCNFLLHQPCAELPLWTTHPLHFSNHNLRLELPIEFFQPTCGACGKLFIRCWFYKCIDCDYRLDIICASRWRNISSDNCNPHAFTPTRDPIELTCKACGLKHSDIACHCSNCLILIHSHCVQFLGTIKIRHGHSLTCTFSLSQGKEHKCKVCNEKVDTKYAAYCCDDQKCDYIAHLRCAYWIRKVSGTSDSLDYATHLVEGNDLNDDEKAAPQEIQHWSHLKHKLILKNEELRDVLKCCEGCMQFIVLPLFYDCAQCNFSLYIRCTKLPQEVMRPEKHPHPLTLHNEDHSNIVQSFRCWPCKRTRSGFSYRCVKDSCFGAIFDAQCNLIPEVFKHKGHQHLLYLSKINHPECNACGQVHDGTNTFECTTCGFHLCIKCATLPLLTRHSYDTHLLYLTYTAEDDSGEHYCQICEQERDENDWFYYCKSCDFATHSRCILGKTWAGLY